MAEENDSKNKRGRTVETDRINRILENEVFREHLGKNKEAEKDRIFCRHDMVHFLDVARIGMIFNLRENLQIPEDLLYAAALLHDIGKHEQYENGTPHEEASARITPLILEKCGYTEAEIAEITEAVLRHRTKSVAEEPTLSGVLYRADKKSRACFACEAREACNWSEEKKNLRLKV